MKRSQAPSPDQVKALCAELITAVPVLVADYEWLYPSGYVKARHGTSGGRTMNENGVEFSIADSMQGTQAYVRDQLAIAGASLLEAVNRIQRAQAALNDAQAAEDKAIPQTIEVHERKRPHPADVKSIEEARAAQRRRRERKRRGVFGSGEENFG